MTTTMTRENDNKIDIRQQLEIKAPRATVFAAILEQIGPGSTQPDGTPMPLKLEAWPGGRWFRDLGQGVGHFWGHVQVIKPPALLELCGPMFMSYPAINFVQYRLEDHRVGTLLSFTHRAIGDILPDHRTGVNMGWNHIMREIVARAQR